MSDGARVVIFCTIIALTFAAVAVFFAIHPHSRPFRQGYGAAQVIINVVD